VTPKVVLVGLPGAGKSATGRRLAKILALAFADSDDLVEAEFGRPIPEIFATVGEAEFRRAEEAAVARALADFDGVLALGGGALDSPDTRAALAGRGVPVVLLRGSVETLALRVGAGQHRPLLAGDPLARQAELALERGPVYEAVATFGVDTDGRTPSQIAATVAARLHEREVTHGV
jgi:shikimate kinase